MTHHAPKPAHRAPSSPIPPPPAGAVRTVIPATRPAINELRAAIDRRLGEVGYGRADAFAVELAFEEAMSNALHHGSGDRPEATIEVLHHIEPGLIYIRVADEGPGFDPHSLPDPTLDANLTSLGGRGLLLMRAYMTEVHFNERGNVVTLIRRSG